jgi:hypothetical protein
MQINDILIGAIGYQKNGCDKVAGCSLAKVELAAHIRTLADVRNMGKNTRYGVQRFKVWNFRLRE